MSNLLIVKDGVHFGNHIDNPIYCFICIPSKYNNSHIETMSDILEIFSLENEYRENKVICDLLKINDKKVLLII